MQKSEIKFVLKSYLIWRVLLFVPIFFAPYFFELQKNFLGGGLQSYLTNPYFYSFANFDGEHYWNIARLGYGDGEQAFFPLYPIIIRLISDVLAFKSPDFMITTGFFVSNVAFLVALFGLYKLLKLDYKEDIVKKSIIFLLLFPGSFYFASLYTESSFLALVVWSFYFYRTKKYLLSSVLGIFTSASRVVGIVLLPVYLFNSFVQRNFEKGKLLLLTMPLGILSYMFYSKETWGDYLKFFSVASGFGEQRSDHIIFLPQVFYRYVVKIIPNLSWDYFPVVFTTLLEFSIASLFLFLIIYSYRKISFDYWMYMILIYIIPTLSGSFSSLPRYVLVSFPLYILLSSFIKNKNLFNFVSVVLIIISVIMQMLFVRGYFVS